MTNEDAVISLIRLTENYPDVKVERLPAPATTNREAWLKSRKKGLGGSDAGAVCGVDPYRTKMDVYLDKTSPSTAQVDNSHMKRGRKLEALIMQEYSETHPEDSILPAQMVTHPKHSWMMGTPDAYIVSPRHTEGRGVMEVKCPARYGFEKIKLHGVPSHYFLQMQHYLAVTGLKWGVFVIFNADSWEMLTVEVEAWDTKEMNVFIEILERFWNENVVPQVPPAETDRDRIELPKANGAIKSREDAQFAELAAAYLTVQQNAKEAAGMQDALRDEMRLLLNDEAGVFEGGGYRVYNTTVAGRKTLDKKAVEAFLVQHGSSVSNYEKQGNDFKTMRVYPTGGTE